MKSRLTREAEARLVQVADGLVGLLGGRGLGRGGGSHGFRCDGHLAHRAVVQAPGHAPQLGQLRSREREDRQAVRTDGGGAARTAAPAGARSVGTLLRAFILL